MYDGILYQIKQRAGNRASLQKILKSHSIPISTKKRLIKALVWHVATYGCKSWTLRKNEETRLASHCQIREASILWSHHEEIRELPGERDNARNNARCTQARKTTDPPMDNIDRWTGLPVEESIRVTEDRDK